jgi:hypothetical protein
MILVHLYAHTVMWVCECPHDTVTMVPLEFVPIHKNKYGPATSQYLHHTPVSINSSLVGSQRMLLVRCYTYATEAIQAYLSRGQAHIIITIRHGHRSTERLMW